MAKLQFVAAFYISEKVYTIDTNTIIECHFTEDIYSMGVIGKMKFVDKQGLFVTDSPVGTDVIFNISHKAGNESTTSKNYAFKIFNVAQTESSGAKNMQKIISVYFCNPELYVLTNQMPPSSYKKTYIHKIITDLVNWASDQNNLPTINLEECKEQIETWPALMQEAILTPKYLIPRMSGKETGTSGYLLYPSSKTTVPFTWNLVTLNKLLQQTTLMKVSDSDDGIYFQHSDVLESYNKILSERHTKASMIFDKELMGVYMQEFKADEKTVVTQYDGFAELYKKVTKLGTGNIRELEAALGKVHYSGEDRKDFMINIRFDRFIKTLCCQNLYQIKVLGHSSRYCGGMIEINHQEATLKGKYLVKAVTHILNNDASYPYIQNLTCIKNAFFEDNTSEGSTNL